MSGERFPLRPRPLPEEALSSWIARLAAAMGVQNDDILVAGLDMPPLPDDQLDTQPPWALLTRLAERTRVPVGELRAMTLEGYVPLLIDQLSTSPDLMQTYAGQYWFFIPPEHRAVQHTQPLVPWQESSPRPLRACPGCLHDDVRPYHRLYWRLAWMGSCPRHGVLLEERSRFIGEREGEEAPPQGHPDLLFLDGLTWQAITSGSVLLPNGRRLHGGCWLRMVRALIDELGLTVQEAQQASVTLRVFWTTHGLGYREGVRRTMPFEMHPPAKQRLLLTVAGTAFSMLCHGQVISQSPWAALLEPCRLQERQGPPASQKGTERLTIRNSEATPSLGALLQQWIEHCRTDPESAAQMRQFLLANSQRHPDPVAYVDQLLMDIGVPLLPSVTFEPSSPL